MHKVRGISMTKQNKTMEMINEIQKSNNVKKFIEENKKNFVEASFFDYLNKLLMDKNLRISEVYKQTQLSKTYVYQIFNRKKLPSRNNILQIAIGMGCSLEEIQKLLKLSHVNMLYIRNKRDSIIIFGITKGFSNIDIEILLESFGEDTLGGILK